MCRNCSSFIKMIRYTPIKSIRLKCLECAGRPKDVRNCSVEDCSLYIFRMGTNPNRAGIGKNTHSNAQNRTQSR